MFDRGEYCLSAGEFQRLCRTTRDTLRYYEAKGLLLPKRDPCNNYARYSHAQVVSFYIIKATLGMGFSLQEIYGSLFEEDSPSLLLDAQLSALKARREELDRCIAAVERGKFLSAYLKRIEGDLLPVLLPMPKRIRLLETALPAEGSPDERDVPACIGRHLTAYDLREYELFPLGAAADPAALREGRVRYTHIASFSGERGAPLQGEQFLAMADRRPESSMDGLLAAMTESCERLGCVPVSAVYTIHVNNLITPDPENRYMKCAFAGVRKA